MKKSAEMDCLELEKIYKARAGDPEAFHSLVESYQRAVFSLCYRMLGNAGDAEDAAQETFLRTYRSLHRYDPGRKFSTWLLSIATHYCIDQLRKRRMLFVSLDDMPFLEVAASAPSPEHALLAGERAEQVQRLLTALSPKDRAAVVMRYWYEFSYDEIGEALSLTNSAVKSRLHRARRELAEAWAEPPAQPVPVKVSA